MTRISTTAIAATLLALTLGACSRSDAPAPVANDTGPATEAVEAPAPVASETPDAPPSPAPTADANATAEAPPPDVAPAPDEQMMDDASATGMTARSTRGEPTTNEAVPVEQVERK
jgi:hypothetical protein